MDIKFLGMPGEEDEMRAAMYRLGAWLSAALEDPLICAEAREDINAWFDTGMPYQTPQSQEAIQQILHSANPYAIGGLTQQDDKTRHMYECMAAALKKELTKG